MNTRIPKHVVWLAACLVVAGLSWPAAAGADDARPRRIRVDPDSIGWRLSTELSLLQAAFATNRQRDIVDRLLYPLDLRRLQIRGTALEQQAIRNGYKVDRDLAALYFDDLFGDEQRMQIADALGMVSGPRSSSSYYDDGGDVVVDAPSRGVYMRYRLSLTPPRDSEVVIDGVSRAVQAEVMLVWGPQSMFDGSMPGADDDAPRGSMQMRLVDGQLYIAALGGTG